MNNFLSNPEFFSYLLSAPKFHFILPGKITGAFGKTTVRHHHGPVCVIVGNGSDGFLYGGNPHIFFLAFGLYHDFLSVFFQNEICAIVMTEFRQLYPVPQMPKMYGQIFFKGSSA